MKTLIKNSSEGTTKLVLYSNISTEGAIALLELTLKTIEANQIFPQLN
jgi:hypothetical protein